MEREAAQSRSTESGDEFAKKSETQHILCIPSRLVCTPKGCLIKEHRFGSSEPSSWPETVPWLGSNMSLSPGEGDKK